MSKVKNQKSTTARGFTLIEFLLYFGLLAAVMTAVIGFSAEVVRSRNKSRIMAEAEQNARLAVLRVLRGVRQADGLNVGSSVFDADNGILSLQTAATSTNPTVFDLSGGAIRIKEASASATPLTGPEVEVTKLRFSRDTLPAGSRAVTVEVGMRYATTSTDRLLNYAISASGTAVIRKQ